MVLGRGSLKKGWGKAGENDCPMLSGRKVWSEPQDEWILARTCLEHRDLGAGGEEWDQIA